MKKCSNCGVSVYSTNKKCPLCQRPLSKEDTTAEKTWYPLYSVAEARQPNRFVSRLTAFIAIVIISICAFTNFFATPDTWWCLNVITCVLYGWLLIRHTFLSKVHLGQKIIVQVLGLTGMLLILNMLEGGSRWSVNYIFPFLIIGATFLITLIVVVKKMLWKEFVGFIIALILLGFLPLLLYVIGVSQILWAAATSELYAFLTFSGMIIFSDKGFKNEMLRRFHF